MTPAEVLAEVLRRLLYLAKLRRSAVALTRPDEPAARLAASALASRVSVHVGTEDSPWFRRDLTEALRAVGWGSVNRAGTRMWKGVALR